MLPFKLNSINMSYLMVSVLGGYLRKGNPHELVMHQVWCSQIKFKLISSKKFNRGSTGGNYFNVNYQLCFGS